MPQTSFGRLSIRDVYLSPTRRGLFSFVLSVGGGSCREAGGVFCYCSLLWDLCPFALMGPLLPLWISAFFHQRTLHFPHFFAKGGL